MSHKRQNEVGKTRPLRVDQRADHAQRHQSEELDAAPDEGEQVGACFRVVADLLRVLRFFERVSLDVNYGARWTHLEYCSNAVLPERPVRFLSAGLDPRISGYVQGRKEG